MTNAVNLASAAGTGFAFRNRIINGDMRIDQRYGGTSVTSVVSFFGAYSLDRWGSLATAASKYTFQQNAGAVTPPSGFQNYIGITSSSAYSLAVGDYFGIGQRIEGFNFADANWGTANAQSVTLSFWVRSSLTGTFGAAVQNSAQTRSYPFTYAVNAANTWEYKTVTIPGDTSGTWIGATNGIGLSLIFGIGVGTTYSGPANTWAGANYVSATGSTSVVGTNGATFYLTGVQLEVGSVATPFERRLYGQELALCQRYYQVNARVNGIWTTVNILRCIYPFPVIMRASGTLSIINTNGYHEWWNQSAYNGISGISGLAGTQSADLIMTSSANRGRSFNDPALIEGGVIAINAEL